MDDEAGFPPSVSGVESLTEGPESARAPGPVHNGDTARSAVGASSGPEVQPPAAAVLCLLSCYGEALDRLQRQPAVVWLSNRGVPRRLFGQPLLLPRANFAAVVLAEMHAASRVDALVRRAQRQASLNVGGDTPLDIPRLQTFRSSLTPVSRRTFWLVIVLLTLAVAFPVAWITDYLRVLAPKALFCSHRFSLRTFLSEFDGGTGGGGPRLICRHLGSGPSLTETLARVAHLNLSPGSFIDTALTVRASGLQVLLLLLAVATLSLCVVLLVFRSGFRLKRLAFTTTESAHAGGSLLRAGARSEGLYPVEAEVIETAGLGPIREVPLDLLVSAGLLILPLTIAIDLFVSATLPGLGFATAATSVVVGAALVSAMALRLQWLARLWRSRRGTRVLEPRERWLPDGSTVLVRSGGYGTVLLSVGYLVWLVALLASRPPLPDLALAMLFVLPILSWPLAILWWYRLHRELRAYGRCVGADWCASPRSACCRRSS